MEGRGGRENAIVGWGCRGGWGVCGGLGEGEGEGRGGGGGHLRRLARIQFWGN